MKLKITFGGETRFDQPIRRITRTRVQGSPGIRVSLRVGNGRTVEANQARLTSGIFSDDSNP